jgi:hypothetical protein
MALDRSNGLARAVSEPRADAAVDKHRNELRHASGGHLAVRLVHQVPDDGVWHCPRELIGEALGNLVHLISK